MSFSYQIRVSMGRSTGGEAITRSPGRTGSREPRPGCTRTPLSSLGGSSCPGTPDIKSRAVARCGVQSCQERPVGHSIDEPEDLYLFNPEAVMGDSNEIIPAYLEHLKSGRCSRLGQ